MQTAASGSALSGSRSLSRHGAVGRSTDRKRHRAKHPLLLCVSLFYSLAHLRLLWKQSQLWLACVKAGTINTPSAHMHLLLVAWELVTLATSVLLQHGFLTGASDSAIADRGFLPVAVIIPVFQHVMALSSAEFLQVERGWWQFHGTMVVLGVLHGFTPAHTLLQILITTPLATVLQCYGQCYTQPCSTTFRELISCSATHGYPIAFAGFAAWALTYTVSRGHFRRQAGGGALSTVVAAPGSPNLDAAAAPTPAAAEREPPPHRTGSFGAMFPTQAEQFHSGLARFTRSSLSRRRPPAPVPNETPTGPHRTPAAATADDGRTPMFSAGSRPSSRSENPSWAAHSHSHSQFSPSPMPFESFGIRVFQRLGLEPYFRALEVWVNAVVDRIDDGLVVRVTCLPVAAYSLTYALMVRMRFPGYSFSTLSSDTFLMYMAVWFLLGRDSCTFDIATAMQQVREQLAASFTALGQARPQTVAELVDSVRQQIAGGSSTPGMEGNIAGEELQVLELLGEGTFGKVHKGMWRGTVVAIKSMVLPSNAGLRRERMAIMEAAISAALSHPHVLQTYTYSMQPLKDSGSAQSRPQDGAQHAKHASASLPTADTQASSAHGMEVRLVLEYMDRGTLRDALDSGVFINPAGDEVDYEAVLETVSEVAKGMLHLHSLNILHGDLKARNVLLKSSTADSRGFTCKIADFGLSHKMEELETHISSMFQGTPSHMAPEVFLEGMQSKAADVYAFGITMWEAYTGKRAFANVAKALLPHHVAEKHERPHFPRGTPASYVRLAQRCWAPDPAARPSFKEAVSALTELLSRCSAGLEDPQEEQQGTGGEPNASFTSAQGGATLAPVEGAPSAPESQAPAGAAQMLVHWRDMDQGPRLVPQQSLRRSSVRSAAGSARSASEARSSTPLPTPHGDSPAGLAVKPAAPSSCISPLEPQPTAMTISGHIDELQLRQQQQQSGAGAADDIQMAGIVIGNDGDSTASLKFADGLPDALNELPSAIMVGNFGDTEADSMW